MKKQQKHSLILIAALVLFAAAAMLFSRNVSEARLAGKQPYVYISMDGKDIFKSRLTKDAASLFEKAELCDREHVFLENGRIVFRGERGGENILAVEEKPEGGTGVRCLEADCPDRICVKTGFAVPDTGSIVCLPHRMTVRLSAG